MDPAAPARQAMLPMRCIGPHDRQAIGKLRSLFGTAGSWAQFFVAAESPVRTVADLECLIDQPITRR